jgi:hypothetical protein
MELQKTLLELAANRPEHQVQNRLMACPDRQLAIALLGMDPDEVDSIVSRIAPVKAKRVREELSLAAVRGLDMPTRMRILKRLVDSLREDQQVRGERSYLRPRQPRGRTR